MGNIYLGYIPWTFQQTVVKYQSFLIATSFFGRTPSCSCFVMLWNQPKHKLAWYVPIIIKPPYVSKNAVVHQLYHWGSLFRLTKYGVSNDFWERSLFDIIDGQWEVWHIWTLELGSIMQSYYRKSQKANGSDHVWDSMTGDALKPNEKGAWFFLTKSETSIFYFSFWENPNLLLLPILLLLCF